MLLGSGSSMAALQDRRAAHPGNPSTIEDFQAGDVNRKPRQRATDLPGRVKAFHLKNVEVVNRA